MATNKDDLILRGKALKDLRAIKDMLVAQGDPFLASVMNRAICCIENQPAQPAEPITTAEWRAVNTDCRGYTVSFECSGCECITLMGYAMKECEHDRCPVCGAHMLKGGPRNG